MKTKRIFLALFAAAACLLYVGCTQGPTRADVAALNESLQNARADVAAARGAVEAIKAEAATQPGGAELVKKIDAVTKPIVTADKGLEKVAPVVDAIAKKAADPNASLGEVVAAGVQAAQPLIPPQYQAYVALGSLAISLLGNIIQNRRNARTIAAANANTDAINKAIAVGAIKVTPSAASVVDEKVADHRLGDNLVDAIAAAPKDTPAK